MRCCQVTTARIFSLFILALFSTQSFTFVNAQSSIDALTVTSLPTSVDSTSDTTATTIATTAAAATTSDDTKTTSESTPTSSSEAAATSTTAAAATTSSTAAASSTAEATSASNESTSSSPSAAAATTSTATSAATSAASSASTVATNADVVTSATTSSQATTSIDSVATEGIAETSSTYSVPIEPTVSDSSSTTTTAAAAATTSTSTSSKGFFSNTAAVAGVFSVVGVIAILATVSIVSRIARRRRKRRDAEDTAYLEKDIGQTGYADGRGSDDSHSEVLVTNAAPDAYPDRTSHYGLPYSDGTQPRDSIIEYAKGTAYAAARFQAGPYQYNGQNSSTDGAFTNAHYQAQAQASAYDTYQNADPYSIARPGTTNPYYRQMGHGY